MDGSDSAAAGFPRPRLVVSRCLGFEPVRYNGQIVEDAFVQRLARHCDVTVVCPEVEIGLGVPRPPVRLVRERGGAVRLVQPETGRDLTELMAGFAAGFLGELPEVDGFVLKSRSPSCGLGDVKLFSTAEETEHRGRTTGAFASVAVERFETAAAFEDEARLHDEALRERFLTLLFGLARLRAVAATTERSELARFHARYKYVLLAHEEVGMRELGHLVAAVAERPWEETLSRYRARFVRALARPASLGGQVNALQHAFGHVSEAIEPSERALFVDRMEEVRAGRLSPAGALTLLRGWARRSENGYLEAQAYLSPYPSDLA